MKLISEWLETIKNDIIRTKALKNFDLQGNEDKYVRSLADAFNDAFTWYITPEQDEYWRDIYSKLRSDRSVLEWLKLIEDDEIREQAIGNTLISNSHYRTDNIQEAIEQAFNWDNSKEGSEYWVDIVNKIERGEIKLLEEEITI
jgi:hypothetical protein